MGMREPVFSVYLSSFLVPLIRSVDIELPLVPLVKPLAKGFILLICDFGLEWSSLG